MQGVDPLIVILEFDSRATVFGEITDLGIAVVHPYTRADRESANGVIVPTQEAQIEHITIRIA